jgi:hypothetical protein
MIDPILCLPQELTEQTAPMLFSEQLEVLGIISLHTSNEIMTPRSDGQYVYRLYCVLHTMH